MTLSLEKKITAGFGIVLALFLAIGAATWWNASRFSEAFSWVDHTHKVLYDLERVHTNLLEVQARSRGYILTNDARQHQMYEESYARTLESLTRLRGETQDNGVQRQRVDQIGALLQDVRGRFEHRHEIRRTNGLDAAAADLANAGSQGPFTQIVSLIDTMEGEERELLGERSAMFQRASRLTGIAVVIGGLVALTALVLALVRLLRDLAHRRRTEEALRISEHRLNVMIESIRDYAIVMVDPVGTVIRWNPGAERLLGYTADEIIGKNMATFYTPEAVAAQEPQKHIETAKNGGRIADEDWRVRKDGSRFWANIIMTAARDPNGKLQGFVKVTRDLTAQRVAEDRINRLNNDLQAQNTRLEAVNRELEAFSYSVSHDLRAPLRHIDGFVNLLTKQSGAVLDEKARRNLGIISASAKQMGRLIDDLLSFSRMGRAQMSVADLDQNMVVHAVIKEGDFGRERPIEWHISPLPHTRGDPAMMRQVWFNLIDNAVKYSSRSPHPRIEIGSQPSSQPNEIIYYIRDNGVGFDMKYAPKLFGVFQRLHSEAEFSGTGIGLANIRRIVARHGGRTWAESVIGQGATFYFSLPKEPAAVV